MGAGVSFISYRIKQHRQIYLPLPLAKSEWSSRIVKIHKRHYNLNEFHSETEFELILYEMNADWKHHNFYKGYLSSSTNNTELTDNTF